MYLWVLSPVSEGGKKHKNISFHRGLDTPSPDEQQEWDIEDKEFYEKEGLNIATRNLWARPAASRHLSWVRFFLRTCSDPSFRPPSRTYSWALPSGSCTWISSLPVLRPPPNGTCRHRTHPNAVDVLQVVRRLDQDPICTHRRPMTSLDTSPHST